MIARLLLLTVALLSVSPVQAEHPLFASDVTLEVRLPIDFKELCRPREDAQCEFSPATLTYEDEAGAERSLAVEVKVRGGWRSLSRNCSVPLLWLRFDPDITNGTVFEGQSVLPLTTHCGKGLALSRRRSGAPRTSYEQYLLREFLGHRIYNELSEVSVRARLARIGYSEPGRLRRSVGYYAFFTEHFDSVAARTASVRLPRGSYDPEAIDAQATARLALFHFMIGNTDWSIVRERNVVLLQNGDGRQFPVPYDLDMSGLVAADYAGPAPSLPIDNVKQRYFLGHCQPGVDWEALFADFAEHKEAILDLPGEIPGMDRASWRLTRTYLKKFYGILESGDDRQEQILGACKPWPPSPVDHTSSLDQAG